jgi:hypothetical protein
MEVQSRSILVSAGAGAGAGARVVDWHGSYYAGKTSMVSWVNTEEELGRKGGFIDYHCSSKDPGFGR